MTLIDGNLAALSKERFSVALGNSLAQQLGVGVGDQVDAVLPQLSVTPRSGPSIPPANRAGGGFSRRLTR